MLELKKYGENVKDALCQTGGNANLSGHDQSPIQGRVIPSVGGFLIMTMRRNIQIFGSLNNESGLQAVGMGTPSTLQTCGLTGRRKRKKSGLALSSLIPNIIQRNIGVYSGGEVMCPQVLPGAIASVSRAPVGLGGSSSGGCNDTDLHLGNHSDDIKEISKSPFSTIYEEQHKTAVVSVDPNQKRVKITTPRISISRSRKGKGKQSVKRLGKSFNETAVGVTRVTPGTIAPRITMPVAIVNNLPATVATPTTQLHPPCSSSTSLASTISLSSSQSTSQGGNSAYPESRASPLRRDSSSSQAVEIVRGEGTAHGIGEAETSNLTEDIALMERTIGEVSTSNPSRVDHMGGSSDDMVHNYFMEKVRCLV